MPEKSEIVINTSPLIALIAGLGNLEILRHVFTTVYVPCEVIEEICIKSNRKFGADVINNDNWLKKTYVKMEISPVLKNMLDIGEASVIQFAINNKISTVCIDETVGRRVAKLFNLRLTGSMGILLKARKTGFPMNVKQIIQNMLQNGIFLSSHLIDFILKESGE